MIKKSSGEKVVWLIQGEKGDGRKRGDYLKAGGEIGARNLLEKGSEYFLNEKHLENEHCKYI